MTATDEIWHPCPKCGKPIDEYGWDEPGIAAFSLEPHKCVYLSDIKAVLAMAGLIATYLIYFGVGMMYGG